MASPSSRDCRSPLPGDSRRARNLPRSGRVRQECFHPCAQAEDCLYLNVHEPTAAVCRAKLLSWFNPGAHSYSDQVQLTTAANLPDKAS